VRALACANGLFLTVYATACGGATSTVRISRQMSCNAGGNSQAGSRGARQAACSGTGCFSLLAHVCACSSTRNSSLRGREPLVRRIPAQLVQLRSRFTE
jgi:hypothetical protein